MVKNSAFVFIKPHAVTEKVKEFVQTYFETRSISIIKSGEIQAEEIDKKQLVDKHYYAIASKAILVKPNKLPVPKEKFKAQFGEEFDDALTAGKCFNAADACEQLGVDADGLDSLWAAAKNAGKVVKLGGGFYCGLVGDSSKQIYTFNAFFVAMRQKFVAKGAKIYYYVVEWEKDALSWEDFRGKVLGPTDPAGAPEESLRGAILKDWQALDLRHAPNTGDNGVHASASPFEALAERMNWLGYRPDRDNFGKHLLKAGVSRSLIKDWSLDPQVSYGIIPITASLFDTLEDLDTDHCLAKCQMMAMFTGSDNQDDKKSSKLETDIATLREQLTAYEDIAKAAALIQDFMPVDLGADQPDKGKGSKGKGKGKKK